MDCFAGISALRRRGIHILASSVIVACSLPSVARAQDTAIEIHSASGGALISKGSSRIQDCSADLWLQPGQTIDFWVFVYYTSTGEGVPDVTLYREGSISDPGAGGHIHSGYDFGMINQTQSSTGPNGESAYFTFTAGAASGGMTPTFLYDYVGGNGNFSPCNAFKISQEEEEFAWLGTGHFIKVGATTSHPFNHYGTSSFLTKMGSLADAYYAQYTEDLAYNDSSLIRGGRFDINADYANPHSGHRLGANVDVRANTAANAIPHNTAIRNWFEAKVEDIFGSAPALESSGTSNEHYHISG